MEAKKFNVFVIGSGIAGQTVATSCAKAGLKVAIADKRAFGGTCANRGCDPKKVLLAATEALQQTAQLKGIGLEGKMEINWKKLQKFKRTFTKSVPKATEKKLLEAGITLYHQSPKFLDRNTLSVEGKMIKADHIVIATGLEPVNLPINGSKHLNTSDDFLNLKTLPEKLVFIGGGYVGMEFAHIAARAGAKVTVIDSGDLPLKGFDQDLVERLVAYSKTLGIEFIMNAKASTIKKLKKNYKVYYKQGDKKHHLKTAMVFNTAGRVPALKALDLEKGRVDFNANGIEVNTFLQSKSNDLVYACGDVADSNLPLTPLSGREGYVVAENIIRNRKKRIDVPVIPSAVFTLPNLASVGYSEEEAKKRYKNVIVKSGDASSWFNAKRWNAPVYAYKILLNERTGEIVGAHLLGPDAGETINTFALAINHKMTEDDLQGTIFSYPSWVYDTKSMV
ncbi:pyridine nucleotide-disulfide oxidoreductase [Croceivirga radicis]|uniref:Pyridine nucleotide-disulfide oxidoreductase n=1 Tax=Croceivirga radicis TaxID=1929488 RepID=A0A1V6LUA7_9FLAO|nr:NAD(P)/FAD-dependent oxidoreductase [Croceivirga radicis]OQD43586.1 pyridine nucleotide-disulfide oxidoreductase [Croceivirga radicis]